MKSSSHKCPIRVTTGVENHINYEHRLLKFDETSHMNWDIVRNNLMNLHSTFCFECMLRALACISIQTVIHFCYDASLNSVTFPLGHAPSPDLSFKQSTL